jgi:hypothetical protein
MIMQPRDFVYNSIYKGALRLSASERRAHEAAVTGLDAYKKCRYKKPSQMIDARIKQAVAETKKDNKH